jgi:quinol monooxygenase YgiN
MAQVNTNKNDLKMERIMIVAYRPYKGKEEVFRSQLFRQIEIYREEELLSDRDPWFMRTKNGAYLVFFEWKSQEVVDSLETNPQIQQIWMQFEKICSFEKPSSVQEFQEMFSHFESIRFNPQ